MRNHDQRFRFAPNPRVAVNGETHRNAGRRHRRGVTLVEVVMSTAIMSVVLGGIGSTMLIATRALPDGQDPLDGVAEGGVVAGDLITELQCAISFTERTTTSVAFNVADRTGDAVAETIRYAWSGVAGDPLTRRYNGGTVVSALESVHEFALSYDLITVDEQPPATSTERAETLLISHDPAAPGAERLIKSTGWLGQYFAPTLAADATEWRVTRVKLMAASHGPAKGVTAVQLRPATAGNVPSVTVLEEVLMYESGLTRSLLWQEFTFANVFGLSPPEGLCLVLAVKVADKNVAVIDYSSNGTGGMLTSANSGNTWTNNSAQSLRYYVYGTVTAPALPAVITRSFVRSVGVKVRAGSKYAPLIETAVGILNKPEVTGL